MITGEEFDKSLLSTFFVESYQKNGSSRISGEEYRKLLMNHFFLSNFRPKTGSREISGGFKFLCINLTQSI